MLQGLSRERADIEHDYGGFQSCRTVRRYSSCVAPYRQVAAVSALQNARWELFAQNLAKGMPQSHAYTGAGYLARGNSAEANASILIRNPKVAARLSELQAPAIARAVASAEAIVEEAARIAFGDIRELVSWDGDAVTLRDSDELTPEQAATVKQVKVKRTTRTGRDGEQYVTEEREIQVWDKLSALALLAKRHPEFRDAGVNVNIDARTLVVKGRLGK